MPVPTTTARPTTTREPVQFPPDVPQGLLRLGEDHLKRAVKYMPSASQRTFLLLDLNFTSNAIITAFVIYVRNPGPMECSAWRKSDTKSSVYELIGQKAVEFKISEQFQFQRVELRQDEYIHVQIGDVLGFSNHLDMGIVGYNFEKSSLAVADDYIGNTIGSEVEVDGLPMPQKYSFGADYIAGGYQ